MCIDEKLGNTIERRIQQTRNFKVGNVVPNIILPDSIGSFVELNKIISKKTLIVFYASWCPHCQTLLPQIYELYENQKESQFEVMAVSIDTSRADWLNFVKRNNPDWINISDLNGWDGQTAMAYFIYATPTMYLVDKDKKIITIPKNKDDIIL